MDNYKILLLGGYGNFGKRIAQSLAERADAAELELLIAGRTIAKAEALCMELRQNSKVNTVAIGLNIQAPNFAWRLIELAPQLTIHCCGPFQNQSYLVPSACIAASSHYIDLADDRRYVCDISQLDNAASAAGISVISGASSVLGLSSVVIDHFKHEFRSLHSLKYAIAPGNRLERGRATIAAILSYTGKPFRNWQRGQWSEIYGWMDSIRHEFGGPVGVRPLANIDVPDLELFPERYPQLQSLRFRAELELGFMHDTMAAMAWLVKKGWVNNWQPWAGICQHISQWFYSLGSDIGGMEIKMSGADNNGEPKKITWSLVAENGVGPHILTIPTLTLTDKFIRQPPLANGAFFCLGMFSLQEFTDFAASWGIYTHIRKL